MTMGLAGLLLAAGLGLAIFTAVKRRRGAAQR
jgi:hypothetical protein